MTFIERSSLLSGRGYLFSGPKLNFSLFKTVLKGQWKVTTANIIQYIIKYLFDNMLKPLKVNIEELTYYLSNLNFCYI